MDFSDVDQERDKFEDAPKFGPHVIILSFPKYCRYRAMMRRLEDVENLYLKYKIVNALGGFYVKHPNTRVLFCRDTFDYPELEGHELLCNHLAPKLKGRPRGKRKKRSVSPGSESNESESSISNHYTRISEKSNGVCGTNSVATRRSTRCHENNENKQFMKVLSAFMKSKQLPMGRIPSLGYKELNLHEFYTRVQKLGGYECVTTNRLWKSIFDDMTGHLNSTSAATIIRRHYERFLLPYERHEKGEEDKPLPGSERRRLKSKQTDTGSSDSDSGSVSPTTSRSGTSTPIEAENSKESVSPGKTSSLRSIRVKPQKDKPMELDQNASNTPTLIKDEVEEFKNNNDDNEPIKVESSDSTVAIKEEIKIEVKQEISVDEDVKPKIEPEEVKPLLIPEKVKTEGSNPAEPVTNAIAPVASTVVPEKNLSPIEGKENIPIKTDDVETISAARRSPKVEFRNEDDTAIRDVKKIKLDILKEGGLEVTPVKSVPTATSIKEFRPSVIQAPTNNFLKPAVMAPPSLMTNVLSKRSIHPSSSVGSGVNVTHIKTPSTPVKQMIKQPESFPYLNGATPPKVVQSKSIYSYSEKTVYGNPKDFLQSQVITPHAPKSHFPPLRYGGSDPMDLSLTSPQKPVVEIMPVPQNLSTAAQSSYNSRASVTKNLYKTTPPLLDGRKLGPNLEITLVNPKQQPITPTPRHHKRSGTETYAQKIAKLKSEELNSRHSKYANIPPIHHHNKSTMDIPVPSPYIKNNSSVVPKSIPTDYNRQSAQAIPQKHLVPPMPPQAMPSYHHPSFAPPPDNSSRLSAPFMNMMDPLYYQAALQNVYSNFTSLPPMLPIPTAEQLKFYADLMAHGRFNHPAAYSHPADGHPSVNNKKP
ncbi:hypothetical protein ABEB36_005388 [Hypothenemus hampei]